MAASRQVGVIAFLAALAAVSGGLFPPDARAADPLTERVSVSSDEAQGDNGSSDPSVSEDGRFVAFNSDASNFFSGDTNGDDDVFVRDRLAGTTERVSVGVGGAVGDNSSISPAITPDGRYVAFRSFATNLVAGDTNTTDDIFVRDRQAGITERVSVSSDEVEAGGGSTSAVISADGRFVGFVSFATNLVTGDGNASSDVFVRDRLNGTTERVSVGPNGVENPTGSSRFGMSADGRFIAFGTEGSLVPADTNGPVSDVYVRDRQNATTERVSVAADGTQSNGYSGFNSDIDLSADGRYVAFESSATNLVANDTNGFSDFFRKDRVTGAIVRVSVAADGTQGNANPFLPGIDISADGRFVSFETAASNLVPNDTNGATDVFVHDTVTHETVRVSVGSQGDGASRSPDLAARVPFAGFESFATNLVSGDTNAEFDVFLRQFRKASGYFVLDDEGGIFSFGSASYKGSVPGLRAGGTPVGEAAIVDLEVTPSGNGYYVLDDKGGIFAFGDAAYFGSMPALRAAGTCVCSAPVLDMAVTPSGQGYLILDAQGGIFTFGDATFFGSLPGLRNAGVPIGNAQGVDLSITPSGLGYLILDDIGGIFTFGDATFFGSLPGLRAAGTPIGNAPSIRLAITPTGDGYLVLDDIGGMFTFGDARFFGSIPSLRNAGTCTCPAAGVDLALTPTGGGYLILDDIGGIFTFGDGEFFGSLPALRAAGVAIGPNESIRVDLVSSMVGG